MQLEPHLAQHEVDFSRAVTCHMREKTNALSSSYRGQ